MKLRLQTDRGEELLLDQDAVPVTHRGGRGIKVTRDGEKLIAAGPDKVRMFYVRGEAAEGLTTFWLCQECGRMVERAELEPLPEGGCEHRWIPLEV